MIKHQGCRVPPSVQADHASAPTFRPVPPPPRNALPHLLHPTCHPVLPPLAAGTSPAPPPTSTAKQTPCSQPIPPRAPLPLPLPPHPHPGLTVPGSAGGGRARGLQLGAGDLTHHPNTGTLCNTHATLHTDAPVMPVSSCCSKHGLPSPAARHRAWPRQSRCAWARTKVPPGTAGLWAVGLQATAGQRLTRLRLRLEAGRALGPQARSLRALPHPDSPGDRPGATAWRAGDRGWPVRVRVRVRKGTCGHMWACAGRRAAHRFTRPYSPRGPTGAPWTRHVDLVSGICPHGP